MTPAADPTIPNGFSPQLYQAYTSNRATDFFFKQLDGNYYFISRVILIVCNIRRANDNQSIGLVYDESISMRGVQNDFFQSYFVPDLSAIT